MDILEVFKFFQTYGTTGMGIMTAIWAYDRWRQHRLDARFVQLRRELKKTQDELNNIRNEYRGRDVQIMTALHKTGVSPKTGKAGAGLWPRYGFGVGEVPS